MKKTLYALAILACGLASAAWAAPIPPEPSPIVKVQAAVLPSDAADQQLAIDAAAADHQAAAPAGQYRPAHAGYPGQVQPYVLRQVRTRAGLDPERAAKALQVKPSDQWARPWRSTGWPS